MSVFLVSRVLIVRPCLVFVVSVFVVRWLCCLLVGVGCSLRVVVVFFVVSCSVFVVSCCSLVVVRWLSFVVGSWLFLLVVLRWVL